MNHERIDQIIDNHHGEASSLIQVLLEIQRENHWLPKEALARVSERLEVPLRGSSTSPPSTRPSAWSPKGRHEVHVCMGTACHVRGAGRVLETRSRADRHQSPGETDLDLKFSLETVNCLGCCALGPVMEIDGKTHGRLSAADTTDVLQRLRVGGVDDSIDSARARGAETADRVRRDPDTPCITVCAGTGCLASGAGGHRRVQPGNRGSGLEVEPWVSEAPVATGFCEKGPIVVIDPEEICYLQVTPEDVPEIIARTHQGQRGHRAASLC